MELEKTWCRGYMIRNHEVGMNMAVMNTQSGSCHSGTGSVIQEQNDNVS